MHRLSYYALTGLLFLGMSIKSSAVSQTRKHPSQKPAIQKPAAGEKGNQSGIFYDVGYVFTLSAPKGWVLDDATGRANGINAVLYRHGESWVHGDAVMYANINRKMKGRQDTVQKVVEFDIEQARKRSPDVVVETAPTLTTGDGRKAIVYTFTYAGKKAAKEKTAYIDTPKVVVFLVLSTQTESEYTRALPDFSKLVRSFHFLSQNVQIDSVQPPKQRNTRPGIP